MGARDILSWLAIAILAACGEGPAEPCPEPDRDGDGHDDVACGGDDCDDDDGAVHPGAQDAAGWTRRTVAAGEQFDPSIAFDAANLAWLSYATDESGGGTLSLAHEEGVEWSSATADGPSAGWQSSLAIGLDGSLHVLSNTRDATPEVRHAYGIDGAFEGESVGPGADPSVAVDADGQVRAAFRLGQSPDAELVVATRAGGSWTTERVDGPGDTGYGPSLVADEAGSLHVGFTRVDVASGGRQVVVAANDSGGWDVEVVAAGQGSVSLGIDAAGSLHVVYSALDESGTSTGLAHAVRSAGGTWTAAPIRPDAPRDAAPTLAVHPRGWLEVAYLDGDRLFHATNAPGEWSTDLVDHVSPLAPPSLAIGRAEIAIAFRDPEGAMVVTSSGDLDCDGR